MNSKLISGSLLVLFLSSNQAVSANLSHQNSPTEEAYIKLSSSEVNAEELKERAEELVERVLENSEDAIEIIRTYPYSATILWVYESIMERRDQVGDDVDTKIKSVKEKLQEIFGQVVSYPYKDKLEEAGEVARNYPYGEKAKEAYLFSKYFAAALIKKLQN